MVKFICDNSECLNFEIESNFLGFPETAECGGCGTILAASPSDLPEPEQFVVSGPLPSPEEN